MDIGEAHIFAHYSLVGNHYNCFENYLLETLAVLVFIILDHSLVIFKDFVLDYSFYLMVNLNSSVSSK
jgi:hypothetical protein